jgi:prepilin-type N-terminal cleavage/methylation domain-containing protein
MKKVMKKNKGFTLVELIVVLVILAILAAILVPALLGYIDRAKQQQIVLNAKSCLTAAQAEMSSMYSKDETTGAGSATDKFTADENSRILKTADVENVCQELVVGCDSARTVGERKGDKITYVKYSESGKTIYYDGSSWVESYSSTPAVSYTVKASSSTASN